MLAIVPFGGLAINSLSYTLLLCLENINSIEDIPMPHIHGSEPRPVSARQLWGISFDIN